MSRKITMIIGEPCTGKSLIMLQFMDHTPDRGRPIPWEMSLKPFAHHYYEREKLTVLGRYDEPNTQFPGTDRLSMSVAPRVREWIDEDPLAHSVVFEGDRLGNLKMAEYLIAKGYDFMCLVIHTNPAILAERRARERVQRREFVTGQATKVRNIMNGLSLTGRVKVAENNTPSDKVDIANWLWAERVN